MDVVVGRPDRGGDDPGRAEGFVQCTVRIVTGQRKFVLVIQVGRSCCNNLSIALECNRIVVIRAANGRDNNSVFPKVLSRLPSEL